VLPAPNTTSASLSLASVSCASADTCMTFGSATSTGTKPIAELWNGQAWTITPLPNL